MWINDVLRIFCWLVIGIMALIPAAWLIGLIRRKLFKK